LRGRGLPVEIARRRGPELVAAVQCEEETGAAGLDRGAARGQSPAGLRIVGGCAVDVAERGARRLRIAPSAFGMRAARDAG
jgi:hypothetical protein